MTYQIIYNRSEDGAQFVSEFKNETAKDNFVQTLSRAGIPYVTRVVDDKKWRLCRVVFELRDIEPALLDPNYKWAYTFGDPDELSKSHKVVKGQCANGEVKPVFVVKSWLATETEVIQLRQHLAAEGKLKTGHLSLIVSGVA